ncbi:hypothetical protein A6R68_13791, partial [Neotoma lepida]
TNLEHLTTITDPNQNMQYCLPAPPTQNMPMGPMHQRGPLPFSCSHDMPSDGMVVQHDKHFHDFLQVSMTLLKVTTILCHFLEHAYAEPDNDESMVTNGKIWSQPIHEYANKSMPYYTPAASSAAKYATWKCAGLSRTT